MKKLTITMHIAPEDAVRAGSATCGDVPLVLTDQDLATLTEGQRDALSRHVAGEDGYRAALRGATAATPDELARLLDVRVAELTASAARATEVADAKIEAWLLDHGTEEQTLSLRRSGERSWDRYGAVSRPVVQSKRLYRWDLASATPDLFSRWEEADGKVEAENKLRAEEVFALLETELAVFLEAEAAAEEAAEEAARRVAGLRAEAIAELPLGLRARHEAGYASTYEVDAALADAALRAAGLADAGLKARQWDESRALHQLTDAEYEMLCAVRDGPLPEGAVVTPERVWSWDEWRLALLGEDGDEDGEVRDRVDEARGVVVEWTTDYGLTVRGFVPFTV